LAYRLSKFVDGAWSPHVYDDVFGLEGSYLVAAPSKEPLSLASALLEVMAPPYAIELEVLEPEGLDAKDGEVVSIARGVDRGTAREWLLQNANLLESDARLALLIHGSAGERLVYDEHNRLLLTGSVMDYEGILLSEGLMPGDVSVPMPHAHQYRDELTPELARLLA
jgi:hypothetical protein